MRRRPPWHHEWSHVDRTADPAFFVRFLDAFREPLHTAMAIPPCRSFAYLGLQEGHQVLDVGCGTGEFTRPLAALVGETGRVVGVDNSDVMIAEARTRACAQGAAVQFQVGDAYHLDFPDAIFDCCLATALFQHLEHPRRGLAEMIRVARPGARVVGVEHDWGTFAIDAADRAVTRKILDFFCDTVRDGWMGRRLPGLYRELGLEDIAVACTTLALTDYPTLEEWVLRGTVDDAQAAGLLSAEEVAGWFDDLEQRAQRGRFFSAVNLVHVSGRKPEPP